MVPKSLRFWFVVHFAADIVFAIPLLFFPEVFLPMLGWTVVDPLSSRLVGAALMGIGTESLIGRNASAEVFRGMLNLKLIWSSSAIVGISLAMRNGAPAFAWVFLGIFVAFFFLWLFYRVTLKME